MEKIMFVCTGNMCRSPFAEVVLRKMFDNIGLDTTDIASCGTYDLGNGPRDPMMVKVAAELGYTLDGETRYMGEVNWTDVNLIIAMSDYHRNELTKVIPYDKWNQIKLFNDYFLGKTGEVPDPHYQTETVYRQSAEMIVKGCAAYVERIKVEKKV